MTLAVSREQIIEFRRSANGLNSKAPISSDALRRAAWAGLQDSMPRAALLSIHARVSGTPSDVLDDPTLVQVWGPRFSTYAIAAEDVPIFTLSRMPDDAKGRHRAEVTADALERVLAGGRMKDREANAALTGHPFHLRYGTATGRVLIRWEGALAPTIWMVPKPQTSVADARREMARRYLHVFGPANAATFAEWAGISARSGSATFESLTAEMIPVSTPIGEAWLLAADEQALRADPSPAAPARLLPSGDTFFLLWGRNRELLVPDTRRRQELWTSRVWPGALLVDGQIAGVWRRANEKVDIETWRALTSEEKEAVEEEARSMPLPGLTRQISVSFSQAA